MFLPSERQDILVCNYISVSTELELGCLTKLRTR